MIDKEKLISDSNNILDYNIHRVSIDNIIYEIENGDYNIKHVAVDEYKDDEDV